MALTNFLSDAEGWSKKVFDSNGEPSDPAACRMKYGISHSRVNADDADLADPLKPQWIYRGVPLRHHHHLDLPDIGVYRDLVLGNVVVGIAGCALIDVRLLQKGSP